MRRVINYAFYTFLFVLLIINNPINVIARPGCCSWHGGESGCSGNKTLCADGTISSCPCDGTTSSSSYGSSTTSSNYDNSDVDDDTFTIMFWVIAIGGFFLIAYIYDWGKQLKEKNEKLKLQKIEEQKIEKAQGLKNNIINGENIKNLFLTVDHNIFYKLTSDDIVDIINSMALNKSDMQYFITQLQNVFGKFSDIFKEICDKLILSSPVLYDDLYNYQRFTLEYIFKIRNDNYNFIFIRLLKNREIVFLKRILQENLRCEFTFYKDKVVDLYDILCDVNDIELIKLMVLNNSVKYEFMYNDYFKNNFETKNYEKLKIYFALFQKNIYSEEYSVSIIFSWLIHYQDIDLVKYYLDACNDINAFLQKYGANFIYLSIRRTWVDVIEYLLENYKGIDLNVIIDGGTPLIYACYKKNYKIVKALLDYGVDVNFKDSEGNTALMCACDSRKLKNCKILFENGARFENETYETLLEAALEGKTRDFLPSVGFMNHIYSSKTNRRKTNWY